MPVMDGIQTMQLLSEHHTTQKVLALTMEDEEITIIKMIKAGAKGYLLKDVHPDNFKFAVKMVVEQGFYYSGKVEQVLRDSEIEDKEFAPHTKFTEKEMRFAKFACSEITYRVIADEMGVSPKTIENYRESVFKKLEVKSRIGIVIYAMKNNLFDI